MKRFITVFVVVCLAVMAASAQTTSKQLEQLQRDLQAAQAARDAQAARANSLEGQIQNLSAQEKTQVGQVTALNGRLTKLETERDFVSMQLEKTQKKSDTLELEIKTLTAKIDYQKIQVSRLIVSLDREKSNRYVKLMARAENAFDLAVKTRDLDTIQDVNLSVITDLKTNVTQLNAKNTEYVSVIAKLNEYQRKLELKKVAITQNRQQLNGSITRLRATQKGRQALLYQAVRAQQVASVQAGNVFAQIIQERKRLAEIRRQRAEAARLRRLAEAKRKREEEARIAAIRNQRERDRQQQLESQRQTQVRTEIDNSIPPPLPASVGRLQFPISGGQIAADFGIEGDWMTITAPQDGAPVLSAAAGEVAIVQLLGANYGYSVIITHTDLGTVQTYYGNLQFPNVRSGQYVKSGQVIGYLGGGTLLPANELQFKVARNGTSVNPRGYF